MATNNVPPRTISAPLFHRGGGAGGNFAPNYPHHGPPQHTMHHHHTQHHNYAPHPSMYPPSHYNPSVGYPNGGQQWQQQQQAQPRVIVNPASGHPATPVPVPQPQQPVAAHREERSPGRSPGPQPGSPVSIEPSMPRPNIESPTTPNVPEMPSRDGPPADERPATCVYSFKFLKHLSSETDKLPEKVRVWAKQSLWPTERSAPAHLFNREEIFSGTGTKKLSVFAQKKRTLSMQVLGIFGKVTKDNYARVEEELLALPIRQSEPSEINEMVEKVYQKAIRPVDSIYVPLYTDLIVAMIRATSQAQFLVPGVASDKTVGSHIRKAVIEYCQKQFEKPRDLERHETHDEKGNPLPEEQVEEARAYLKKKLKANINFLGHLFTKKLVTEKVVNIVLYDLMYGSGQERKKKRPDDFELEMFCTLLVRVVDEVTSKVREWFPSYKKSMEQILPKITDQRIKFLLEDFINAFTTEDFTELKAKDNSGEPLSVKDQEQKMIQEKMQQHIAIVAKKPPIVRHPCEPMPEEVKKPDPPTPEQMNMAMQKLCEGTRTEVLDKLAALEPPERLQSIYEWLWRVFTTLRCSKDRDHMGELMMKLKEERLLSEKAIYDLMTKVAARQAAEHLYVDVPKLFSCWTQMVSSGECLKVDLHTIFLRELVEPAVRTPITEILSFINIANDAIASVHRGDELEKDLRRFRILPCLLMYTQPWMADQEEEEEEDEDAGKDILDEAYHEKKVDPEVKVFQKLIEGAQGSDLGKEFTRTPERDQLLVMKYTCAIFTYSRCNPKEELDSSCCDVLRAMVRILPDDAEKAILAEAYCCWKDLDRCPENSFRFFVKSLLQKKIIKQQHIEAFQMYLIKHYKHQQGVADADSLDNLNSDK